ncbi:hypothetical protein ABT093_08770 [Kitasatospora sp. NPDC002551]|uniref:hypothetical protein n=1 Tax=Kitasatospora sp. NPDC002551 TaxID=3154539 RepID=UPI003323BC7B
MGTTDSTASAPLRSPEQGVDAPGTPGRRPSAALRFLPAGAAYLVLVAVLLKSGTAPLDVAKYTGYAVWAVVLPGTLVFRALRRRPHTLVEDLAFGAVVGLVLELAAWALLVSLGLQSLALAWPLAVVVPFAAVPALRRHWRPSGYRIPSTAWSWAVAATVAFTSLYLYVVALRTNPIVPDSETTRQYIDLPYLLSLAGNAKHHVPLTFPQAAGEPLNYHWFTFAHMAMTSMVGDIDLAVVQMRLMVPALSALAMVVAAVTAWRLTARPWSGPVAAALVFAIGEFTVNYPADVNSWVFGALSVPLMSWASLSLTYSLPLLLALIAAVGDRLRGADADAAVPGFGRGAFVLAGLFALASSAAKASSLPVTLAGLAFAGAVVLLVERRIPWNIVGLGAVLGAAQVFTTAVIFRFESYGLEVVPFGNIKGYWADPQQLRSAPVQAGVVLLTVGAFVLNHQLRVAGLVPLLWRRRLALQPVQWFLLGGALAGPALYFVVNGFNASYFTLAGLPFGILLSAWGYAESVERARLSRRAAIALAAGTVLFVALLTWGIQRYSRDWAEFVLRNTGDLTQPRTYAALLPAVAAAAALAGIALVGGLLWWALGRRAVPGLRRRGGLVLLTGVLVAGAPTLLLDGLQTREHVWESAWPMPAGQVQAARWVREHSEPDDVLATNTHCRPEDDYADPNRGCGNALSFWLSGYSERSVLVEGWAYSPRVMAAGNGAFWDEPLLRLNDEVFHRPTAENVGRLRDEHHVRYLVADRKAGADTAALGALARPVYDNGRVAVFELS